MSIDPKGVAPGLAPQAPADQTINLKCRNPHCDSMSAVKVNLGAPDGPIAPSNRLYRCVKCNHQWGLSAGGFLNL